MLRLIVISFVFISLMLFGYSLVRGVVPEQYKKSKIAIEASKVIDYVSKKTNDYNDYLKEAYRKLKVEGLKEVDASDIKKLLMSFEKNNTRALVYFYNFDCNKCSSALKKINQLHDFHEKIGIKTYAVAVSSNKPSVSQGINKLIGYPDFTPFILSGEGASSLSIIMDTYNLKFVSVPFIILVSGDGKIKEITEGMIEALVGKKRDSYE